MAKNTYVSVSFDISRLLFTTLKFSKKISQILLEKEKAIPKTLFVTKEAFKAIMKLKTKYQTTVPPLVFVRSCSEKGNEGIKVFNSVCERGKLEA